ncbi:MAG TPA: hypothetical protein VMV44_03345 [Rectinemataceae bacterium]|nr:hypothetical protein [Rectinemataceae bacterium]
MQKDIDVYQIVRAFAARNNLTQIEYRGFSQAVARQARQGDQSNPVFRDLAVNPDTILVPQLLSMARDKRLALEMVGNEIGSIVLPEHYVGVFHQEYRRMDENSDVPFPDEDSLKTIVPADWIQAISLETDLSSIAESTEDRPVPLYRLVFPDGLKALVIPSAFVPSKVIEYAVLKIRQYLRRGANKDYLYNKLLYAFASKEQVLKDAFALVLTRPYEAIEELRKSSNDFTFTFWAYLSSHLKKDLDKKNDKTPEEVSTYQASVICEIFANYYKGKAQRIVDLDLAFKALDACLRKPPLHFSIEDICLFKDGKGTPLLGKYTREELEAWLKDETTKAKAGALPELFIVATASGRRSYVMKDRMLALAMRLVGEARQDLRARILHEWKRLLEDFATTPAMEDDKAWRRELSFRIEERFSLLDALLKDRLLPLVYDELTSKGEAQPELERFFYRGDLVPVDELLDLHRKNMIADARMLLPFWYSVPILSALAKLFLRKSSAKKKAVKVPVFEKEEGEPAKAAAPKERKKEFAAAAAKVSGKLVPAGMTIDEYLLELEGRWNTMLNRDAKANLTEDVNSLVRDYLRGIIRTMKAENFTLDRVKGLASTLAGTPALLRIKNHSALELYIQLYMARALQK